MENFTIDWKYAIFGKYSINELPDLKDKYKQYCLDHYRREEKVFFFCQLFPTLQNYGQGI